MTLLAALFRCGTWGSECGVESAVPVLNSPLHAQGSPPPLTAADFFPLKSGPRRVYEVKAASTGTVYDEVGDTAGIGDKICVSIVRTNPLSRSKETTYYTVDGSTVLIVGYGEDRSHATSNVGSPLEKGQTKLTNVLMTLEPAMPLFKYEGGETQWSYTALPRIDGHDTDSVAIVGTTKPGPVRTVLGRKVETIEVRTQVTLGTGAYPQKVMETTVYGRGIGMVESTRKSILNKASSEIRTRLVGLEDTPKG